MIPMSVVKKTARELMDKAAIEIPDDYLTGLKKAADNEDGDLSSFVLHAMLENYEAAKEDRRAMCADTGVPRWYVKMGNEATLEGGPVALEEALRGATAEATDGVPLRPNRVHPLWRTDHNNNVGLNGGVSVGAYDLRFFAEAGERGVRGSWPGGNRRPRLRIRGVAAHGESKADSILYLGAESEGKPHKLPLVPR